MKILAINSTDSDLVRITGYLVKKSDIEAFFEGKSLRQDTVKLGAMQAKNSNILNRTVRIT